MDKSNAKSHRNDEGEELTPEEMEAAIALYKAQKIAEQASGGAVDGEQEVEKSPMEQVRENIDRRDAEGEGMSPEDVIAGQKKDIEVLLDELDKLQASSDMNNDENIEENQDSEKENAEKHGDDGKETQEEEKGVNMDSVDRLFAERLDICRMADKLNLDGVEGLPVNEGRKKIIKAVNPKMNLDGKSGSYIKAAYDIAKDTYNSRKSTDDQRQKMLDTQIRKDAREESNSIAARKEMIQKMTGGKK